MGFQLNNRLVNRLIGISMAAAVIVSCNVVSQISDIKAKNASVTANGQNTPQSCESAGNSVVIIPFSDGMNDNSQYDSHKLYEVYSKMVEDEKKNEKRTTGNAGDSVSSQTSAEAVTQTTVDSTTQTTTQTSSVSSQTISDTTVTQAGSEQTVSNGKLPFNYNDVSSIAANMNNLGNFVDTIAPVSFSWDASEYADRGYVQVTLTSASGSITLDVKPIQQEAEEIEPYTIDGEVSGIINANSLSELDWYKYNKDSGCVIRSVTWLRPGFAVEPVRGIDIDTGLAELTDNYLCVNGGATTLYKAADVIESEDKLNALLASENAYTFVGGRLYTMDGYLQKYYGGKTDSYEFADCDMVVQYGCNSIIDHNYISGSWIIEYAISHDAVAGISFMNKSYYKKTEVHGGSTSSSTGSTSATDGEKEATFPIFPEAETTATTVQNSEKTERNVTTSESTGAQTSHDIDVPEAAAEAVIEAAVDAIA